MKIENENIYQLAIFFLLLQQVWTQRVVAESENNKPAMQLIDFSSGNGAATFFPSNKPDASMMLADEYPLDIKTILPHINVGNTELKPEIIAEEIIHIAGLNKIYADYVKILFKYNPNVKIKVIKNNSHELHGASAYYNQHKKHLLLSENIKTEQCWPKLLHEVIHAANDGGLTAIYQKNSKYPVPYLRGDKPKYEKFLKQGKTRIQEAYDLWKKSKKNRLTAEKKKKLKQYLKAADAMNKPPYNTGLDVKNWDIPPEMQGYFLNTIDLKTKIGKTINVDKVLSKPIGNIIVSGYNYDEKNKKLAIRFSSPKEPLQNMYDLILGIEKIIKNSYKKTHHILEQQAYLYTYFPIEVLNVFYTEMLEYDINFLSIILESEPANVPSEQQRLEKELKEELRALEALFKR